MPDIDFQSRILVALDVATPLEAIGLAENLRGLVGGFKVGLELISGRDADQVISELQRLDVRIFYDAKFNDIPNTVAGAARALAERGIWMFNVHASAGRAALVAAAESKGTSKLIAVTVLTSLATEQCAEIFGKDPLDKVIQFAQLASECGADGIVCAPTELEAIKASPTTRGLLCVVPGIRPQWATVGDQSRYATPGQAICSGADYLVIGRPITKPPASIGSPVDAVRRIIEEINETLATT